VVQTQWLVRVIDWLGFGVDFYDGGVFVKVFDLVEIFLVLNVLVFVRVGVLDVFVFGVLVDVTLGNVNVFVLSVLGVLRGVLVLGNINVNVGVLGALDALRGVLGNVSVLGSKRTARSTRNRRQRMMSVRPRLQRIGLV